MYVVKNDQLDLDVSLCLDQFDGVEKFLSTGNKSAR